MNTLKRLKSLPVKTQKLLGLTIVLVMLLTLPLVLWGITTQRFDPNKRAFPITPPVSSPTPVSVCIPDNNIISVAPSDSSTGTCHDIQTAINIIGNDGTVIIEPGVYNLSSTLNVQGKTNITITGNSEYGQDASVINFIPNGWGFLIENSSGSLKWLKIQGGSSNGMVSVHNSSDFQLGYLRIDSQTSHTVDVQGSNNISIYNTEITSSAGALEIQNSNYTSVSNSTIHNSSNGISIFNSAASVVVGNTIRTNNESGLSLYNASDTTINHNTIINNTTGVSINGNISLVNFSNNLVVYNTGVGISFSGSNFTRTLAHNDVWNNSGGNYIGFDDYTGINGNISQDPLINFDDALNPCLYPNSPAILYSGSNVYDVIGSLSVCANNATPSPSPTSPPQCQVCQTQYGEVNSCSYPDPETGTVSNGRCNSDRRVVQCGGVDYCCNGYWSTNMSYCTSPSPSPTASPSPLPVPGDVNGDSHVNIIDIGIAIDNYRLSNPIDTRADLNNDGIVNIVDIGIIVDNYGT